MKPQRRNDAISIYRTPTSLLISLRQARTVETVISLRPVKLEVAAVKTKEEHSLKLTVFNGKLFVNMLNTSLSDTKRDPLYRNSEQLLAKIPGTLTGYIHPKTLPVINAFLDEHFPNRDIPELNDLEDSLKDELRYYGGFGVSPEVRHNVANTAVRIVSLAFPIFSTLMENRLNDGFYAFYRWDVRNRPHYRLHSYKDFLIAEFGVYRKDLAKAVAKSNDSAVRWASRFAPIIDIDSIIQALLEKPRRSGDDIESMEAIRHFPRNTIKRLLSEGLSSQIDPIMIDDALEMAPFVLPEEQKLCKSWKGVHDYGMVHYTNDREEKGIRHTKEFEDFFKNAKFEGYQVVPLRDSQAFVQTGKLMDVCVGSVGYISRAYDGDGYCFRLDNEEGNAYALAEVAKNSSDEWKIAQLRGMNNSNLPTEFHEMLEKELSKYINIKQKKKEYSHA